MSEHHVLIPEQVFTALMSVAEQESKRISELVNETLRQYLCESS
jgi:hypothetical protein